MFLTDCVHQKVVDKHWDETGEWLNNGEGLLYRLMKPGDLPLVNDSELVKICYVYYDYETKKASQTITVSIRLNEVDLIPGFETSIMMLGNHGKGLFKIPRSLTGNAPDGRKFDYMLYEIEIVGCPDR